MENNTKWEINNNLSIKNWYHHDKKKGMVDKVIKPLIVHCRKRDKIVFCSSFYILSWVQMLIWADEQNIRKKSKLTNKPFVHVISKTDTKYNIKVSNVIIICSI